MGAEMTVRARVEGVETNREDVKGKKNLGENSPN